MDFYDRYEEIRDLIKSYKTLSVLEEENVVYRIYHNENYFIASIIFDDPQVKVYNSFLPKTNTKKIIKFNCDKNKFLIELEFNIMSEHSNKDVMIKNNLNHYFSVLSLEKISSKVKYNNGRFLNLTVNVTELSNEDIYRLLDLIRFFQKKVQVNY